MSEKCCFISDSALGSICPKVVYIFRTLGRRLRDTTTLDAVGREDIARLAAQAAGRSATPITRRAKRHSFRQLRAEPPESPSVPSGHQTTRRPSSHLNGIAQFRGRVAQMDWAPAAVEVQTIKRQVRDDPAGHPAHVFVLDEEITCGAAPCADRLASPIQFMGGVLVQRRGYTRLDVPSQLKGAEAIGEAYRAEVLHQRIEQLDRERPAVPSCPEPMTS